MVHRINEQEFGIRDFKDVKVTCYTCHRGSEKPLTAPPPGSNLVPPPPAQTPKPAERG
jgi:cytochrome c peroxidase